MSLRLAAAGRMWEPRPTTRGEDAVREIWSGTWGKLAAADGDPVAYALRDRGHDAATRTPDLPLNALLGRPLEVRFTGKIACTACGRAVKKTFGEGFCFPCSQSRADADLCMVKPELCHHGNPAAPCRDEAFAQAQCFQPHVLYASLTSGPKVGITRKVNVPVRWLDQGAVRAVPLAELPSRREVGRLEHELAGRHADRTHWMAMLKQAEPEADFEGFVAAILAELAALGVAPLPPADRAERRFRYPVLRHPAKVTSFNLDRDPVAGGVLDGVKGQYLIFDQGVINARKYAGYRVVLSEQP